MKSRQEIRAEATKRAIVTAAGALFATRGFDAVTMREIAKQAGCSHTTIYLYFKDKEALLHHIAVGPLQALHQQLLAVLQNDERLPADKLQTVAWEFLRFGLEQRNLYDLFFMERATRVDVEATELEVQHVRLQLFNLLKRAIREYLPAATADELILAYARSYFYTLHGIISTYQHASEPLEQLRERLDSTFALAIEVMLVGFKQTVLQRS